ncbi:peptidylprolyl isomerase [Campylobacter fetus]|uniref:Iron receptor CfrA n=1 Tax=Campylobacter fetus subsp. testudinum TaxID=1507806 RepID=A0AAX0HC84_CAMFE|nr:peptidylprolyl isomerase [Campylobacter fetus]EAK0829263.1 iron receptor CfrA [Campylobacter fetus]OCR86368.1 iron receptor CfrA [Campylobacter fetus subsp. testudinum]OCR91230.1 iron receptor CfrA [Campylobacter fetus subsp. testudinum]OCR93926.1 iron receptor CfrA [Campylobacter fetus subsp. testudinum]OCS02597.1 iron receptor CfrA [Campylobacter fetus subsp. testudinum]
MKKIVFLTVFLLSISHAEYVNGLVAIVENEPITDYEIQQVMTKMNVSPNDALSVLIRERLEDAQIRTLGISADNYEADEKIAALAQANGIDTATFKNVIESRGISSEDFKNDIKTGIKKEKLYARILNNPSQNITPENARRFYDANPKMFVQFEKISVTRYLTNNKQSLNEISKSPMSVQPGVSIENVVLESKELNPQLRYILLNTKNGSFTPIFQTANGFEMFYVYSKEGSYLPDFNSIEKEVVTAMASQEQEIAVADYFNKLRVKANIEIIKR